MSVEGVTPHLDLAFRRHRVHGTWLERRLFRWPYTLSRGFRLDAAPQDMLSVILQTVSGAIQADDRLSQRIHLGANAAVHLSTQGAAPVYRAPPGLAAQEDVEIALEDGAFIEYLPDIRILFPHARLAQRVTVRLPVTATAIIADGFVMHDPSGAAGAFSRYHSETILQRTDGSLLSLDRLCLDDAPRQCGPRASYVAFGNLVVATGRNVSWLDAFCAEAAARLARLPGLYAAGSALPNGAGVSFRLAAIDGRHLRLGVQAVWGAARLHLFGGERAALRAEPAASLRGLAIRSLVTQ
jgi:urease accessory protein